jgi:hypothetical protein
VRLAIAAAHRPRRRVGTHGAESTRGDRVVGALGRVGGRRGTAIDGIADGGSISRSRRRASEPWRRSRGSTVSPSASSPNSCCTSPECSTGDASQKGARFRRPVRFVRAPTRGPSGHARLLPRPRPEASTSSAMARHYISRHAEDSSTGEERPAKGGQAQRLTA